MVGRLRSVGDTHIGTFIHTPTKTTHTHGRTDDHRQGQALRGAGNSRRRPRRLDATGTAAALALARGVRAGGGRGGGFGGRGEVGGEAAEEGGDAYWGVCGSGAG